MPTLAAVVIMHGNPMLIQLVRRSIESRIAATVVAEAKDFPSAEKLVMRLVDGTLQAKVAILGLKLEPGDNDGTTGQRIYQMIRQVAPNVRIAVFSSIPFSVQPGDAYVYHVGSQALNQLLEAVRRLLKDDHIKSTAMPET